MILNSSDLLDRFWFQSARINNYPASAISYVYTLFDLVGMSHLITSLIYVFCKTSSDINFF